MLVMRRPLLEKLRRSSREHSVDALEGESATALEEIPGGAIGKVELRGSSWSARNSGGSSIRRGERCRVQKIEGLMLWVRPEGGTE
jgi:membrane protein implicated in regulation of membrane protease activity